MDASVDATAAIFAQRKNNIDNQTVYDLTGQVIQSSLYESQVSGCEFFTKQLEAVCPGGYWYSLCLKTDFQCGEKKKSIVCATYTEKSKGYNRRDATQHVSIEEEWNHRVTTQPVSKFTVTTKMRDRLAKIDSETIKALQIVVCNITEISDKTSVIMSAHLTGCQHATTGIHYHVLIHTDKEYNNTYTRRKIGKNMTSLNTTVRKCTELGWTVANMVQPSDQRMFVGCNNRSLLGVVNGIRDVVVQMWTDKVVPDPPVRATEIITIDTNDDGIDESDGVEFTKASEASSSKGRDTSDFLSVSRSKYYQALKLRKVVEFIHYVMDRCYVSNYSNEEFKLAVEGKLSVNEQDLLRLYMASEKTFNAAREEKMQLYSVADLSYHASMYFKYNLPENAGQIANYWVEKLDTNEGDVKGLWLIPFCVTMSILKGWHQKVGCVLVTGKSNSGKTQIFCKPFQEWVRPFIPLRCDSSDFAFEECSTFHSLWYIDESDQVAYTGKILEGLKNIMGRQKFAVNRKYKSGSVSMAKPGIFMKQRNDWPGVEGMSLKALQNRFYHINIDTIGDTLPERMDHNYWAMLWAVLCIAIEEFPRIVPDDLTATECYYDQNTIYICRNIVRRLSNLAVYKTYEQAESRSMLSARNSEIC